MNVKDELFVELTDAELESACGGSNFSNVNIYPGSNAQSIGNTSSGNVGNFAFSRGSADGGITNGSYASASNYYYYRPSAPRW